MKPKREILTPMDMQKWKKSTVSLKKKKFFLITKKINKISGIPRARRIYHNT